MASTRFAPFFGFLIKPAAIRSCFASETFTFPPFRDYALHTSQQPTAHPLQITYVLCKIHKSDIFLLTLNFSASRVTPRAISFTTAEYPSTTCEGEIQQRYISVARMDSSVKGLVHGVGAGTVTITAAYGLSNRRINGPQGLQGRICCPFVAPSCV
jgi:hypothetical protein